MFVYLTGKASVSSSLNEVVHFTLEPIIDFYLDGLQTEIHRVEDLMVNSNSDVDMALTDVGDALAKFEGPNTADFIRCEALYYCRHVTYESVFKMWTVFEFIKIGNIQCFRENIFELEVYFPELKMTKVTQKVEYGLTNFFSKYACVSCLTFGHL